MNERPARDRRTELGVIEGFYGRPWSHDDRRAVLQTAAQAGVHAYLWAPKNEPAHRARWAELPEPRHVEAIADLAREARQLGVRWIHGLSPVLRLGRTATDVARIVSRLEPLRASGVASFLLAFDDTWPTFVPRLATRAVGRSHGAIASAVAAALGLGDDGDSELLVVPAVYAGRAADLPAGALAYLRGLAEACRGLRVAWTGPRIFSTWITGSDRRALERATGLSLWIWSNAITNDWLPLVTGAPLGLGGIERLSVGPLANLAPDLADEPTLIAINGAREAHLSRPAIHALGAWGREPTAYDARAALGDGLVAAFGAAGAASLGPLLAAMERHALVAPWRRDLAPLDAACADLEARVAGARDPTPAVDEARRALLELAALPTDLERALGDHPVRREVEGAVRKLTALARAGALALDAFVAAEAGEPIERQAAVRAAQILTEARRVRWDVDAGPFLRLLALARAASRRPARPATVRR